MGVGLYYGAFIIVGGLLALLLSTIAVAAASSLGGSYAVFYGRLGEVCLILEIRRKAAFKNPKVGFVMPFFMLCKISSGHRLNKVKRFANLTCFYQELITSQRQTSLVE